jgi:hypothetical protein
MRQGPYESIIKYSERFNNALKAYIDQKNPKMGDIDIAMDLFHGLDYERYAGFKSEILKRLTAKSITQPTNLTYVPCESFMVHLPDHDIDFVRRGKMCIANWEEVLSVFVTTVYTKAEELHAKKAYELLCTSGYPSMTEAIHLVEDGNISRMPVLTSEDICVAYEIYGSPPEFVRGKMTKKKVSQAIVDEDLMLDEKKQVLYSDVMYIDSNKFLITVCKPLQLPIQNHRERERERDAEQIRPSSTESVEPAM